MSMKLFEIIHAETNSLIREGIKSLLLNEGSNFSIHDVDSKADLEKSLKKSIPNLVIFGYQSSIEFNKQLIQKIKENNSAIKVFINRKC